MNEEEKAAADKYWAEIRAACGKGLPWWLGWAGVSSRRLDKSLAHVRALVESRGETRP